MSEPIFHHCPGSPVAEKIRVVFGIKDLRWHSVEVQRLRAEPDLVPLTGGYRRTPILQIGADVYCDSQCIIRELERRYPEPTLFPGGADGMAWGIGRWTDTGFFTQVMAVVLGSQSTDPTPAPVADLDHVYVGPNLDPLALRADLPHLLAQIRGQLGWAAARLGTGRRFMLGDDPGLPDALVYYLIWFLREGYAGGEELLAEFDALREWLCRVEALGHGEATAMQAAAALAVARDSEPTTERCADPGDPQGLVPGMAVAVRPESGSGDSSVRGEILAVDADRLTLLREDNQVGRIAVHFPRVGYRVAAL